MPSAAAYSTVVSVSWTELSGVTSACQWRARWPWVCHEVQRSLKVGGRLARNAATPSREVGRAAHSRCMRASRPARLRSRASPRRPARGACRPAPCSASPRAGRQRHRAVHQRGVVHALPDQADALGLFGRQLVAGHRQADGSCATDQARQQPGAAAIGNEADLREGLDEARAARRDHQVAAQREVGPAPAATPLTAAITGTGIDGCAAPAAHNAARSRRRRRAAPAPISGSFSPARRKSRGRRR